MAKEKAAAAPGGVTPRTRWSYGLGCIGRDATYTLVSNFILTYLTLAVGLSNWQLGAVGVIMVVARVWDAINDPMMGTIIDNAGANPKGIFKKYGKFKPFILGGALLNVVFTILLFAGVYPKSDGLFVLMFATTYILWGMTFTVNDISYWSMLPSLSLDTKQREKITSTARIGANLGLFIVTALVPALSGIGRLIETYRLIALVIAAVFVACQLLVVWGVTVDKNAVTQNSGATTIGGMARAIFRNDQLLVIVITILLFNIGYFTTTAFGMQFFYFDYGNYGGMEFTLFALCIGVAQILALALYPKFSKNISRKKLFGIAIAMVTVAYVGFMAVGYLLPMNMVILCIIGLILFSGQAVIQLLSYVMLADTVEYGQWKLGQRNDSVTYSLSPFVNKLASAVSAGLFSITMILSGLNYYSNEISALENSGLDKSVVIDEANALITTIPGSATLTMRLSMLILPLLSILACYVVYLKFYKLDENRHAEIVAALSRGETKDSAKKG